MARLSLGQGQGICASCDGPWRASHGPRAPGPGRSPAFYALLCYLILSGFVLFASFAGGLALKTVADLRRRARLIRYIQESDAQAPFVSGELRQAMTS